ncbi:MAG: iron-containing alcohol dehydrogenase, partial [Kiritimatiellae bacterium]|nr:iron-containing alcohol dehydrogenase [Kiritimatiellia bacterium]
GGSVIDCAKAAAAAVDHPGDPWDFFRGGTGVSAARPVAAVLTLPAAGSEGSASCVISNDAVRAKLGIGSDALRPRIAIMDPELTFTLPPFQTAAGVTDMTAHICERYFSGQGPAPVSDNIAAALVRTLRDAAPRALADPRDYEARAAIMWAGTLAHNDLTGCGRGASPSVRAGGWESHALEHELSALDPKITHGAGLAVVLPAWMRHVMRADPGRFAAFGRDALGLAPSGDVVNDAEAAVDALQAFFISMGMPRSLADFGLATDCIGGLVESIGRTKGRVFGAFAELGPEDVAAIYRSAFDQPCPKYRG